MPLRWKVSLFIPLITFLKKQFKKAFVQEALVIIVLSHVLFWHAKEHDLFEALLIFLEKYEKYELDEVVVLILTWSMAFMFIIYRRSLYLSIEIARRKAAEAEISKLAYYDTLTGLPNRRMCYEKLQTIIWKAAKFDYKVASLFIDLDNFKGINDSYGHSCGDELLKQVSDRLQSELREKDIIARISGDEFIIIIDKFKGMKCLNALLQRLLNTSTKPYTLDNKSAFISLSIGVSIYPDNGNNAGKLLKYADTAMYEAKKSGKNIYKHYSEEIRISEKRRSTISQNLRLALNRNQFSVLYQPIIDNKNKRIIGAEALIRWNCSELGMVAPDEFIPIAEENGVIYDIDDWMLLNVCKQNKAWQEAGLEPIVVSINVSASQLNTYKLIDSVNTALSSSKMSAKYLLLEVTETVMMQDLGTATDCLKHLQDLGVSLALDDFGTGYASINYLRKLQLKHLKIDKSFLEKIPFNEEDKITYNTIISLAKNLNIKITAEGIETKEQYCFIQESGCDFLQGYFFSRPVNRKKFEYILSENVLFEDLNKTSLR